jgi:hypothetical protein
MPVTYRTEDERKPHIYYVCGAENAKADFISHLAVNVPDGQHELHADRKEEEYDGACLLLEVRETDVPLLRAAAPVVRRSCIREN